MAILLSKPVVTAAAASLNQELAEFDSVSSKLTPETKGKGSTINIYVNKPANVWVGSDEVPSDYVEDQEKVVNVVLENYSVTKSLGIVEKTNDLIDEQEQIMANMRVGLQRKLKKDFFNSMLATCNTALIAQGQTGLGNTPISWGDVAQAIARVRDSVVGDGDDISVLLPSASQASLLGASATNFWSAKTQEEIFNNKLGSFDGASILTTNISGLRPAPTQTLSLQGTVAEGDNAISITATTSVIPAGSLFYFSDVYALDMEGNPVFNPDGTRALALFATPFDVPIGSTILPLGKQIFISSTAGSTEWAGNKFSNNGVQGSLNGGNAGVGGGVQFISALPTGSPVWANATGNALAGKNNVILVYSKLAMAAATAAPSPLAVKEEYTESRYGVSIRTAIQGTIRSGKTEFRMDAIAGFSGVYAPGAVAVVF